MTDPNLRMLALGLKPTDLAETDSPQLVPFYWEGQHPAHRVTWLVEHLFPLRSVSLIVGESQAGKTFIALDLAVAIASGRPFFGKQVRKGGVLYIATEGAITIPGRLRAARQGLPYDQKMIAIMHEPPPDLMVKSDLDRVIHRARLINEEMLKATGFPLVAIVIDTMMYGFTINNWNEVGETSKAMKVLSRIQNELGAAVIGIHHYGKDPTRGVAGSYALTAAADVILSVFKKGEEGSVKTRWITLTKSRFRETGRRLYFDLESLPPDHREEEGDDEMFVVPSLETSAGTEQKSKVLKGSQGATELKLAFDNALNDEGANISHDDHGPIRAVSLSAVRDRFKNSYKSNGSDPVGARNKAWNRALEKMENGEVHRGQWEGQEWLYVKADDRKVGQG